MYHEELRKKIEGLYLKNKKSIRKNDFDLFHFSVQQKIWQNGHYYNQILDIYNNTNFNANFVNPVYISQGGEGTQSTTTRYEINKEKLSNYCNLYLDGYFMAACSIFDSLAHELNTLFKFIDPTKDINIGIIFNELKQKSNNAEIYKFLKSQRSKKWWKTMNDFRNTLTHESIIATNIDTTTNIITGKEELKSIPLPDNSKKKPFKYEKKYELKEFIEKFHKNIFYVSEQCYKKLIKDIEMSKKLPIKV